MLRKSKKLSQEKLAGALHIQKKELFYSSFQQEDLIKEEILARLAGQSSKKLQKILDILKALDRQ